MKPPLADKNSVLPLNKCVIQYLIAKKLRMHYGMDVAKSEDDWAVYFTVGKGL